MEDDNTYTYTPEKEEKKSVNILKIGFIVALALFSVLAIMLGIVFANKKAQQNKKAAEIETTNPAVEQESTVPADESPYKTGSYKISANGSNLKLRKDHVAGAEELIQIPDTTPITVLEIYHDETAVEDTFAYWGKAEYLGHTGWLSMKYVEKTYDSVVFPEESTTVAPEESTTLAPESTSEAEKTTESTTAAPTTAAPTTAAPTTSAPTTSAPTTSAPTTEPTTKAPSAGGKYKPGSYRVSSVVGNSGLTLRSKAGTSGQKVAYIPSGASLTVTEIVDTGSSEENVRYWGKVTYEGKTGYVSMYYLK